MVDLMGSPPDMPTYVRRSSARRLEQGDVMADVRYGPGWVRRRSGVGGR